MFLKTTLGGIPIEECEARMALVPNILLLKESDLLLIAFLWPLCAYPRGLMKHWLQHIKLCVTAKGRSASFVLGFFFKFGKIFATF